MTTPPIARVFTIRPRRPYNARVKRTPSCSRTADAAKTSTPAVSVIVRTKDRPELLAQALASVDSQSCRDFEVVVVNDGGCEVRALVEQVLTSIMPTLIQLQPGRGRCAAGNAGIAAARGHWLLFLDDDDRLLPDAIAGLLAAAPVEPSVVYGDVEAVRYAPGEGGPGTPWRHFGAAFEPAGLLFENFIPFNAALLPAVIVRELGGLDESLECFEDWDLFLRLSDRVPFVKTPVPVAEYRVIGTAFVDGRGGEKRQLGGRAAIVAKHAARFSPEAIACMVHWVKRNFVARELGQILPPLEQRLAELQAERDDLRAAAIQERVANVSVIIVTLDGKHHLERCLPALLATTGVALEIIVVDNGSRDGTIEWLAVHWPQVKVISLPGNLGFGAANRRGIEVASSEWIALLNNDTEVDPGWLEMLLAPMLADSSIAAACSVLELMHHPGVINAHGGGMTWLGYGFDRAFGQPLAALEKVPAIANVIFPTAAAMLMRRSDFMACGGFDASYFMYHEDVDLGWRWTLAGRRVVVVRDSRVRHAFGGTTAGHHGDAWRARMGMRHNIRSLIKCFGPGMLLRALWNIAKLWRRRRAYREAATAISWNLVHLPGTLIARWRIQRRRVLSDSELFARGLISGAPVPPPPPELPRRLDWREVSDLVPSATLSPGQTSALGRLGPGWFAREDGAAGCFRWTGARATAVMRVRPESSGQLTLGLRGAASGQHVTISCNGTVRKTELDCETRKLSLPVTADAAGALHIEIASSGVIPHTRLGNWDFRELGVAVKTIRFEDEMPAAPRPVSRVSVVIPTFNRWTILEETLAALIRQTHAAAEIVVVDDGSTDGTWERLQAWRNKHSSELPLTTLRQANAGPGRARNLGVKHISGDLVVFIGDDTIPEPDFLAEHVRAQSRHSDPVAVVGFTDWDRARMRVSPLLELVNSEGYQFGYGLLADGEQAPFTCFYTSNISVPREVLGSEPFHSAFTEVNWEDTELGYRLNLAGVAVVYHPAARTRHFHPLDARAFVRRQYRVGKQVGTLLRLQPALANDPAMGLCDPPPTLGLARRLLPLAVPGLGLADRLHVPVPRRIWRRVLRIAFQGGRVDGERLRQRAAKAAL